MVTPKFKKKLVYSLTVEIAIQGCICFLYVQFSAGLLLSPSKTFKILNFCNFKTRYPIYFISFTLFAWGTGARGLDNVVKRSKCADFPEFTQGRRSSGGGGGSRPVPPSPTHFRRKLKKRRLQLFEGTTGRNVWTYLWFQFQMSKKRKRNMRIWHGFE